VQELNRVPLLGSLIQQRTYNDPNTEKQFGYIVYDTGVINVANPPAIVDPGSFPANLQNRAEVQCLSKITDAKLNVALTLAEINKTLALIAGRTKKIANSYNSIRRGNFKQAYADLGFRPGKTSKSVSEMTLEIQYGWRPLMADIVAAYEVLTSGFKRHGVLIKGKSRTHDTVDVPWRSYYVAPDGSFRSKYRDKIEYQCEVILWYEVVNPYLLLASSVGLTNPFTVAWELVPFSFIVDWFVPVGNVLSGLSVEHGLAFKGGTCTKRTIASRECVTEVNSEVIISGASAGKMLTQGFARGSSSSFNMSRTTYNVSPLPRFYYKNPISTEHVLNAIALFGSSRK